MARSIALVLAMALAAGGAAPAPQGAAKGDYLFVWATDVGSRQSDFLAVIDAAPGSPHYAEVVASVPTGAAVGVAHHVEHVMPAGGVLMANDFGSGQTYLFDLRDPAKPRLAGSFGMAGEFMHPHSYARTPAGNVLATYQMRGHDNAEPGALVELDPAGKVLRMTPASDPAAEPFIRPYSLAIVPALDRVVTSSADMHAKEVSHSVQIWRLSDLKLLKTVRLPRGPNGAEGDDPAEPRVLADGRTVIVSTFNCGLYRLDGIDGPEPSATFIHAFAGGGECALPVVAGRYWVATDTSIPGLVALDMSDPAKPREVSRLTLAKDYKAHWISLAPDGARIVITGKAALETRVLMARIDRTTGGLTLVDTFRDKGSAEPGVSFDRANWPHAATGKALPHGAVFSRPD